MCAFQKIFPQHAKLHGSTTCIFIQPRKACLAQHFFAKSHDYTEEMKSFRSKFGKFHYDILLSPGKVSTNKDISSSDLPRLSRKFWHV